MSVGRCAVSRVRSRGDRRQWICRNRSRRRFRSAVVVWASVGDFRFLLQWCYTDEWWFWGGEIFSLLGVGRMAKAHGAKFVEIVDRARREIRECTIEEMRARRAAGDEFLLLDVREESEYAAGRIPGARHLGKGVIERDIEEVVPDPATPLVLYCGGGYRSALAALNLQLMGYTSVISMDGGFRGWKDRGLEIEV